PHRERIAPHASGWTTTAMEFASLNQAWRIPFGAKIIVVPTGEILPSAGRGSLQVTFLVLGSRRTEDPPTVACGDYSVTCRPRLLKHLGGATGSQSHSRGLCTAASAVHGFATSFSFQLTGGSRNGSGMARPRALAVVRSFDYH